ncbi:MAG: C-terminal binding protein [Deinococcales bacterium]
MPSFTIALTDKNLRHSLMVSQELQAAGFNFVYQNCQNFEDIVNLAKDCDVLWIYGSRVPINGQHFAQMPNCKAVIRSGSGVDQIDVEDASQAGLVVVNIPHAHHEAVSDHTIALIFAVGRRIVSQDSSLRQAGWAKSYEKLPLWKLNGKTLGLIGFGLIPRMLVKKLKGFKLDIIVHDPFIDPASLAKEGLRAGSLAEVLRESQIVSLHTPLTKATHHLISDEALALMRKDAILINTSRGPVVNERALVKALEDEQIAGAGLDVFEQEPISPDNPLLKLDNVVLTPHRAGVSDDSIELTWRLSVEACKDLAEGYYPRSYVNPNVKPKVPFKASRH